MSTVGVRLKHGSSLTARCTTEDSAVLLKPRRSLTELRMFEGGAPG